MKFLGFSKIWRRNSQNIFHFKNFFFFEKNYFQEISSQILENPKNFMILFFIPLGFNGEKSLAKFSFSFFPQSISFFPRVFRFFQK